MEKLMLLFLAVVALVNAKAVVDIEMFPRCDRDIILEGNCNTCYCDETDGQIKCRLDKICISDITETEDPTIATESPIICNAGETLHVDCVHCQCNENGTKFDCTTNKDCLHPVVAGCIPGTTTIEGCWSCHCDLDGISRCDQYICDDGPFTPEKNELF